MNNKGKKVYLVTGGAGFIGSNFIRYLFEKYGTDIEVINLDKLTYAGNSENLNDIEEKFPRNYVFIKGDISDANGLNRIFEDYSPDIVVNFAAESHVDRSIESPTDFVRTNITGTFTLLDHFRKFYYDGNIWNPGKLFVQISTDEVYGEAKEGTSFSETSRLAPGNPYSASKASGDLIALSYTRTYAAPIIITRSSNNFGPFQYPEKLIPLVINNCLKKDTIPVYGNGKNIRDWLYVKDNITAIDQVIANGKTGEIYNIGGGNEISNSELVKKIIHIVASFTGLNIDESLIEFVEDRKGHDFRYSLSTEKIRKELDWKPTIDFLRALEETVKWYIDNRNWLEKSTTGVYDTYYKRRYGDI